MVQFLEVLLFKAEVAGNNRFVIFEDPNNSLTWALVDEVHVCKTYMHIYLSA